MKIFTLLMLLFSSPLFSEFSASTRAKILFQIHKGETEKALITYLDACKEGAHDFETLGRAGLILLESGINSSDPEIQLLSLYGIGVSMNKELLPLIARVISSPEIRLQLIALSILEHFFDDEADRALKRALISPSLIVRLEAAYILASRGERDVIDQLEGLYEKVPGKARPLFPEIFAECDREEATRHLRKLLLDSDPDVRLATILAVAESNRESLLPQIRALISSRDYREEEASAYALGEFKDISSKEAIENLFERRIDTVRIQAFAALKKMELPTSRDRLSNENSPFVIDFLEADELEKFLLSKDPIFKINALQRALSLGKKPPLELLKETLFTKKSDLGYLKEYSPGRTLFYWKPIPSASSQGDRYPTLMRETNLFKIDILKKLFLLQEEELLPLARMILESEEHALILPTLQLLAENESTASLALIKEMSGKVGSPFLRIASTLFYYQLTEDLTSEKNLIAWVENAKSHPLIRFKKEEKKSENSLSRVPFALTPDETSQLLVAVIETLAKTRKESAIYALIHAIAYGNPKNRYALAGLLIKATE